MEKSMKRIKAFIGPCAMCCVLGSCGFSPIYSGDGVAGKTHDIYVAPISGTNGIDLRNALKAQFGTDNKPDAPYRLTVDLDAPYTVYKAIQTTGDATWQEVRLTAGYKLADAATGATVIMGSDQASESYPFVRDLVAATSSYTTAVQSAIRVLSDKIGMRITAKLAADK
jgi:hypothetical protein